MMIRLAARTYRWLPCLFCVGLVACHGQSTPAHFQADLCGERHTWDIAPSTGNMLYVAQLPGDRELVVSISVPSARGQDRPGAEVQFNLFTLPDVLHSDRLGQLVGSYRLHAQGAREAGDAVPGRGFATVFRQPESTPPWHAQSGELQVTDVHRTTGDSAAETRVMISGQYHVEIARPGTDGGTCTVSGSFQNASFWLRR